MRKYMRELIIFLLQMLMFYVFPLSLVIYEPITMVLMIVLITQILSIVLGIISKHKIKYLYPIVIAILFLPTVFIYYNESALMHAVWYLVISSVGVVFGTLISLVIGLFKKIIKRQRH